MNALSVVPKIDWLTLTKAYEGDEDAIPTNIQDAAATAAQMARKYSSINDDRAYLLPRSEPFYRWIFQTDSGAEIAVSDRLSQGVKVTWTGTRLPVGQSEQRALWRAIHAENWRISRCDVAIDVINSNVEVLDYWRGRLEERAYDKRGKTQLITSPAGDTITIGSRTSEKYIRIYDKAKEQRRAGDWKRIEIEMKGRTANGLQIEYNDLLRRSAASMLAMMYKTPDTVAKALQAIADGNEPLSGEPRKARGNREIWLMEQVLPALRKTREEQPDVYDKFLAALIDFHTGNKYN